MKDLRDIRTEQLERLFREAAHKAVQEHFAAGRSVVGSKDGIIYRYDSNGTKTEIGKVSPIL